VAVAVAVAVFRALAPVQDSADTGTDTARVLAAVLAASAAWLVVAPYALPWYDAVAWALLPVALVAGCRPVALRRLELLLLVHTGYLSVAYLPGRIVGLPDGIASAQDVVRGALAPVVVLAVAVGLVRLGVPSWGRPSTRAVEAQRSEG
jgi:hypothetical protein